MKRKSFLAYPYVVWSAIFVIIPLILVVFFSFTKESGGGYAFTLENYKEVIDPIYMKVFWAFYSFSRRSYINMPYSWLSSGIYNFKGSCK